MAALPILRLGLQKKKEPNYYDYYYYSLLLLLLLLATATRSRDCGLPNGGNVANGSRAFLQCIGNSLSLFSFPLFVLERILPRPFDWRAFYGRLLLHLQNELLAFGHPRRRCWSRITHRRTLWYSRFIPLYNPSGDTRHDVRLQLAIEANSTPAFAVTE